MNPNFDTIGKQFVSVYYETFDSNRANLGPLYSADSMLSFEGQQQQGADQIVKKLQALPFKTIKHIITTTDCQPTPSNGIIVMVVGQLKTDEDPPHSFSQTFHLVPSVSGSFFVLNDIFRLTLHHG